MSICSDIYLFYNCALLANFKSLLFFNPMFLALFLSLISCEIFTFDSPNKTQLISFTLDPDNINTGFFKVAPGNNMNFKVKITGKDENNVFYSNENIKENEEVHFSFSNTVVQDAFLKIVSYIPDEASPYRSGEIQMKFESTFDTFNSNVSKKQQYEPAIFALDHLLKKLAETSKLTRETYNKSGDLKDQQRKMQGFVIGFSILSLIAFGFFNFFQLYLMKAYLNEKKYL